MGQGTGTGTASVPPPRPPYLPGWMRGIVNTGNTCFMISVLHALYLTSEFRITVTAHVPANPSDLQTGLLMDLLNGTFSALAQPTPRRHPYSPNAHMRYVYNWIRDSQPAPLATTSSDSSESNWLALLPARNEVGSQQDAAEFLLSMSATFYTQHPEFIRHASSWRQQLRLRYGPFVDFAGVCRSQTQCSNCLERYNVYEPFVSIDLPLVGAATAPATTLNECLQTYLSPESGIERTCGNCNCSDATRTLSLVSLQCLLRLVLKRFQYDHHGEVEKLSTTVFIPQRFTIDCGRVQELVQHRVTYTSYAVVMHDGTRAVGHYVTYGQAPDSAEDDWYLFNDGTVTKTVWRPWNQRNAVGDPYIIFCREESREQIQNADT